MKLKLLLTFAAMIGIFLGRSWDSIMEFIATTLEFTAYLIRP